MASESYLANIRRDLSRLAQLGASIVDAHSCFLFIPSPYISSGSQDEMVELVGCHSLTSEIIENCRLGANSGLIGWVAKHHQSMHVSPFQHDSRTLGVYRSDRQLKSFIGIPIVLSETDKLCGVLACDSKKTYAFSKLQGKLLADLSLEISNTIRLRRSTESVGSQDSSWQTFLNRGQELFEALGKGSVEVLRLRQKNFWYLEAKLGLCKSVELLEQVFRLIQQALPPHFPVTKLPNGDILVIVDNMMSSFYENKFRAICNHVNVENIAIDFEFLRTSLKISTRRQRSFEELLGMIASPGQNETDAVQMEVFK